MEEEFLGLFDPSMEDETTSDIDDLNEDCLPSCYGSKTSKKSHTNPQYSKNKKNKKNSNSLQPRSPSSDVNCNVVQSSPDGNVSALNNSIATKAKPHSINMLDKYNDWATRKLAKGSLCSSVPNNPMHDEAMKFTNTAADINSNDKEKLFYPKNTKRKKKNRGAGKKVSILINTGGPTANVPSKKHDNNSVQPERLKRSESNSSTNRNSLKTDLNSSQMLKCCNIEKDQKLLNTTTYENCKAFKRSGSCPCGTSPENENRCLSKQLTDNSNKNTNITRQNSLLVRATQNGDGADICSKLNLKSNQTISTVDGFGSVCLSKSCCGGLNTSNCDIGNKNSTGVSSVNEDEPLNNLHSQNSDETALPDQLPSEPQEGNIEYKLKLINPNQERFKRLVSQVRNFVWIYSELYSNCYYYRIV